ncbi:NAD(P)-dependent oxidoreductase [Inquilinus sp. Marseille-Q2685]|uniref:NAD(P)-dependent oxidoreductase n=1 Tax=Inquilinus sp. Marseille-Q2685 TaxID=2866581 RepID=UPI001CE45758|nr:NAD(P)-dependent oxidoreductase [Inquilinus sp. Marseille-Q2685]
MAKLALIGATGNVGSKILAEALNRGHEVTGIVRNPEKLPQHPNLTAKRGDVFDADGLAGLLAGHDAVISSVHYTASDPALLLQAVKASGVKRYLVVGGAGSLEVAPGVQLVDTPEFPAIYKEEASKGRDYLNLLRGETGLDWTFLSPSAVIAPGERTGTFRLGGDQLLVGADGQSRISQEDYAIALIDELEKPAHIRQRFTVGY